MTRRSSASGMSHILSPISSAADAPEFIHGEERAAPDVEIKKRLLHTGLFPVGSSRRPKTLPREPRFPTAVRTRREALQSTAWSAMAKLVGPEESNARNSEPMFLNPLPHLLTRPCPFEWMGVQPIVLRPGLPHVIDELGSTVPRSSLQVVVTECPTNNSASSSHEAWTGVKRLRHQPEPPAR